MERDQETFAVIGVNELKPTGLHRGLLLNFGTVSLEYKRLVFGSQKNLCKSAESVDEFYL